MEGVKYRDLVSYFRYNPALQPRGLVVYGCIAKSTTDTDVKQLLRHLVKALESFSDINLVRHHRHFLIVV